MSTPFDSSGRVDPKAIASNTSRWIARGVRGVVALGSNGEAPLLDEAESDTVIAAARDVVPRDRVLLAGTGRESTPMTIAVIESPGIPNTSAGIHAPAKALLFAAPDSITPST